MYKEINRSIQSGDIKTFEELLKRNLGEELLTQQKNKIVREKIESIVSILPTENAKLDSDSRIPTAQLRNIQIMFETFIREELKENRKIEINSLLDKFDKNIGEGERYSAHWVIDKKETIKKLAKEMVETHLEKINKDAIIDILNGLDNSSKTIGQGWIRKCINAPGDLEFTKEDLEKFISGNSKEETIRKIEERGESKLYLKAGVSKDEVYDEVYDGLSSKQIKGIVSYEQIERMFGGINVEDENPRFKDYFRKYREEILNNPGIYGRMNWLYYATKDERNCKLSPSQIIEEMSVTDTYDEKLGSGEVAQVYMKAKQREPDIDYYEEYQQIFNKSIQRETLSIPPMKVGQSISRECTGKLLRIDDPLAIAAGTLTDCCQEFGNVGVSSMEHSVTSRNGGVFGVFDEKGNLIAQSWTWRNGSRLCFDNIEVDENIENEETERKKILSMYDVYKKAAEQALSVDREMMDKLLLDGKITVEQYKKFILRDVTIGAGYIDDETLEAKLAENERGSIIEPPDDGKVYSDARSKVYTIAKVEEEDIEEHLQKLRENNLDKAKIFQQKAVGDKNISSSIPYGYDKVDEVENISGRYIGRAIDRISEIRNDKNGYANELAENNGDNDLEEMAEKYDLSVDTMHLSINRDSTWYMLYSNSEFDGEEELYIAEMAMKKDKDNSPEEEKFHRLEAITEMYELFLRATKEEKMIHIKTEDKQFTEFLEKMKDGGLLEISDGEIANNGGQTDLRFSIDEEKTKKVLENVYRELEETRRKNVRMTKNSEMDESR